MDIARKKEKSLTFIFVADEKVFQMKAFEIQDPK